jgi:hypothetical protein
VNFESSHPIIRLEEVEGELKPVETLDSRNCCYISFEQATPTPEFLGGPCTLDPICLDCGYSEEDWHLILDAWYPQKSEHRWTCPNCGKVQRVYDLDWQDGAALARFSIVIDPVAFREAVPGWRLMNELRQATGFTWKYFYFDDNPFNERWD